MTSHWTKQDREDAIKAYGNIDESYDEAFDELAKLASEICETPVAMINLIYPDEQFSKSHIGTDIRTVPVKDSFCIETVESGGSMIIPDTLENDVFRDNKFVTGDPNVRFYAGAAMETEQGVPIGTLCVLDVKPRNLTDMQLRALKTLSSQAMRLFDLRKASHERDKASIINDMIVKSAVDYAIISLDPAGTIQSWNVGAEKILGWTEAEAIGLDIDAIFTAKDEKKNRSEQEMQTAREEGSARDVRWHLKQNGEKFWADGLMMPLLDADESLRGYVKIVRDKTEQHNLAVQRKNLNQEIVHRLKNSMAVVQSLAQQTIRRSRSLKEASISVGERLTSYADAHNTLLRNNWEEAPINTVIEDALEPHKAIRKQIDLSGPEMTIPARRVIGLTLALHELVTNAIKYGSLSEANGRVTMSWTLDEQTDFCFSWVETGGPQVSEPVRKGFGTSILSRITSSYFSGKSELKYEPSGFEYLLTGSVSD